MTCHKLFELWLMIWLVPCNLNAGHFGVRELRGDKKDMVLFDFSLVFCQFAICPWLELNCMLSALDYFQAGPPHIAWLWLFQYLYTCYDENTVTSYSNKQTSLPRGKSLRLEGDGLAQCSLLCCLLTLFCFCRPFEFKAVHSVSLHGDQLKTDFRVINKGEYLLVGTPYSTQSSPSVWAQCSFILPWVRCGKKSDNVNDGWYPRKAFVQTAVILQRIAESCLRILTLYPNLATWQHLESSTKPEC